MTIAANASAGRLVHEGVEHHFCSLECAGKFTADPGRYLA
jgi:YHS domain-containing protein